jgi:hypothetical protein
MTLLLLKQPFMISHITESLFSERQIFFQKRNFANSVKSVYDRTYFEPAERSFGAMHDG